MLMEVTDGLQGSRVQPHPLVELWHQRRDQLHRLCKGALDAGVAQIQRLAENQAEAVVTAIYAVFDELGIERDDRVRAHTVAASVSGD